MKKTFVYGQIGLHRIPREEGDHPSEHPPASPGYVGSMKGPEEAGLNPE